MYTLEDSLAWAEQSAFTARYGAEEPVNLFILDWDPDAAARFHCDAHVVKMVLEVGQLLSTAWHVVSPNLVEEVFVPPPYTKGVARGEQPWWAAALGGQRIYRTSHASHPIAEWVRLNTATYEWTWRLGVALAAEYTRRYKRLHAAEEVLWALEGPPPRLREGALVQPAPAVPEPLCVSSGDYYDTVASYRNYYVEGKQRLLRWTRREAPEWLERRNGKWALK